ncbi:MAG: hypothetical protein KDA75_16900 [Planctomycetaceae bacterium]|nr:hypothetical protein [Planctomycetaceae bacterium]
MQSVRTMAFGAAMLVCGYLLGTTGAFDSSPATAYDDEEQVGPGKDAENKIRTAQRNLQEAMEQLRQDGNYNAITDGVNPFLVLSGGGDALQDLDSGNGIDPWTFAGIYAGKAIPEVAEELGTDDEGRVTYNDKPITVYSRKRLTQMFAEQLRIKDAGL